MKITREIILSLIDPNKSAKHIEAENIIRAYCKEYNKDNNDIDLFLDTIRHVPFMMADCYRTALEYYMKKFNIISIQNQQGETIKYY